MVRFVRFLPRRGTPFPKDRKPRREGRGFRAESTDGAARVIESMLSFDRVVTSEDDSQKNRKKASLYVQRTHAARHAQRGHDGRQDADDQLDDKLPGLLVHGKFKFKINKFKIQNRSNSKLVNSKFKTGI